MNYQSPEAMFVMQLHEAILSRNKAAQQTGRERGVSNTGVVCTAMFARRVYGAGPHYPCTRAVLADDGDGP